MVQNFYSKISFFWYPLNLNKLNLNNKYLSNKNNLIMTKVLVFITTIGF